MVPVPIRGTQYLSGGTQTSDHSYAILSMVVYLKMDSREYHKICFSRPYQEVAADGYLPGVSADD